MKRRVADYIKQQHLLEQDKRYLVALSGGADSVCLLLILKSLGYSVEAIHCNFHLRGEESDRDEQFCKSLCDQQQVPIHLVHFDTREFAVLHHQSIEMAARTLRYRYFSQLCHDLPADAVCVAHHRDDSVETVLMNLIRGTGLHGLTGIHPVVESQEPPLRIIRPLLCTNRSEIEQFLRENRQEYMTDSTNLSSEEAVRNKIRLEVIPLLQQINPSVKESIAQTARWLQEAEKALDNLMPIMEGGTPSIPLSWLRQQPSPEYTLYRLVKDYGFTSSQIEQMACHLDAEPGTLFRSPTHELLFDRGALLIEPIGEPVKPMRIPEVGTYVIHNEMKMRVSLVSRSTSQTPLSTLPSVATLDATAVRFPLTVRATQRGDRFQPFGMKGTKLVSDYLTDRKRSLFDKRRQLVVTDATGQILWLVNERPADTFRVTDDTKTLLCLETLS